MELHNKIRAMREINQWSQEEMAEKLAMSTNGYAKIERGQTKLNLEKLEQIAQIFHIDVIELIAAKDKHLICLINGNSNCSSNYYRNVNALIAENEKLKLTIEHQKELVLQKDHEIQALKEIITLLRNN